MRPLFLFDSSGSIHDLVSREPLVVETATRKEPPSSVTRLTTGVVNSALRESETVTVAALLSALARDPRAVAIPMDEDKP